MAPPAKRSRTAASPTAISPTGRPQRATTQENPPTYNIKKATNDQAKPTPLLKGSPPARRGRPAKSPTPAPAIFKASPPARRGRPPKSPPPAPVITNAIPPARRGRPPKSSTPAPLTTSNSNTQTGAKKHKATSNPVNNADISVVTDATNTTGAMEEDEYDEDGSQFWLMKAEPESRIEKGKDVKFSIDDLRNCSEPEPWNGVRNFAARNNMRSMKKGDLAFFYHSNCKTPGIVGIMEIVQEHSVDESAFDPSDPYYDPKSSRDKPKWDVVHVQFVRKFPEQFTLQRLRTFAKPGGALEEMQVLVQSRLSVSAVRPKEWNFIMGFVKDEDQVESEETENRKSPTKE